MRRNFCQKPLRNYMSKQLNKLFAKRKLMTQSEKKLTLNRSHWTKTKRICGLKVKAKILVVFLLPPGSYCPGSRLNNNLDFFYSKIHELTIMRHKIGLEMCDSKLVFRLLKMRRLYWLQLTEWCVLVVCNPCLTNLFPAPAAPGLSVAPPVQAPPVQAIIRRSARCSERLA